MYGQYTKIICTINLQNYQILPIIRKNRSHVNRKLSYLIGKGFYFFLIFSKSICRSGSQFSIEVPTNPNRGTPRKLSSLSIFLGTRFLLGTYTVPVGNCFVPPIGKSFLARNIRLYSASVERRACGRSFILGSMGMGDFIPEVPQKQNFALPPPFGSI